MRRLFAVDVLFSIQCSICLLSGFCFFRRLRANFVFKLIIAEVVLGWAALSILDLLFSKPDAQGGLGILLFFPIMSIAAAIFGTSIPAVTAFILRRFASPR